MRRSLAALLAAETVSMTGSQMTALALPWFVLTTTGSATRMSLVLGAEIAGYALLGIPSGTVLARLGAKRTMLAADALRAPLALAVPVLHWSGALSLGLLIALAFALGVLSAPYGAAQRVIVADLLHDDEARVGRANSLFQGANRITFLLGPALAGVLIAAIGAPSVLVIDGASYVVSFLLLAALVPGSRARPAGEDAGGLLSGLRYVAREPLLRAWTASFSIGDAAWQAIFAAIPVLVIARYGGDARVAGWLFAAFGVGAVAGNAAAWWLMPRTSGLTLVTRVIMAQALPLWALAFRLPEAGAIAALLASGLANGIVNPPIHSLLTLRPPALLRPKVLTAIFTCDAALAPLGLFTAGPLLQAFGARPVFAGAAALQTVTMAAMALTAVAARRRDLARPAAA